MAKYKEGLNKFSEKLIPKTLKHLILTLIAVPIVSYFLLFFYHLFIDRNYESMNAEQSVKVHLIIGAVLAAACSIYSNILSFYNGSEYSNIGGKWTQRIIDRKPMKRFVVQLFLSLILIIAVVGIFLIWNYREQFVVPAQETIDEKSIMSAEMIVAVFVQSACVFLIFRWFNLSAYVKGASCPKCKAAFAFTTYSYGKVEEKSEFQAKVVKKSQPVGYVVKGDEVIRTMYDKVPTAVHTRVMTTTSQKVNCQCGFCGQSATKFDVSVSGVMWDKHKL